MSQAKAGRAQDKLIATMRKDHAANILICPLDWGTGHAARVQLIAYELKKRGHKVILAVPPSLARTSDYDIYNKIISLPSPSVRYSSQLPLPLALLLQLPLFLFTFLSDRCRLPGILRRHSIDLVISDNRFGLWTKKVPCIYITHQLRVMMPRALRFASAPASAIHRAIASRYDQCWVPDMPGEENLSGLLSHMCRKPPRTRYIGILSRFAIIQPPDGSQQPLPSTPYTLALLSGPEPQRSILEDIIMAQRHRLPGQLVIVAGKPEDDDKKGKRDSDSNSGSGDRKVVLRIAWADSRRLKSLVEQASFIICRSGYSTVMDLVSAGRTALLVPTPGQPEQEYLAGYLSPRHGFSMVSQKELAAGVIPVDEKAGTDPPAKERAGELIITEWLAAGNRLLSQALDDILLH
ncbi:MAG: glycosyltransferase [Bacteroidales bacterium]|nr:glycosyltransferase [Bacteroidales bacterium]